MPPEENEPKICLSMIVKDEADVIVETLEQVKDQIDSWVIVDTGSTDETKALILECLKDKPGELLECEFENFGQARNVALKAAQAYCNDRDKNYYIMTLDADWDVDIDGDIREPLKLGLDGYMWRVSMGSVTYSMMMTTKADQPWSWFGRVHEYLMLEDGSKPTVGKIPMVIKPRRVGGAEQNRYEKDAAWLLEERDQLEAENKTDQAHYARVCYYLAQSYRDAGMLDEALEAFAYRGTLQNTWEEERFYAMYQAGLILSDRDDAAYYNALMYAWGHMPHRCEYLYPIIKRLNKEGRFVEALELSQMALKRAQKREGALFRVDWVYEWGMLFEYTLCLFYTGNVQEALRQSQKLLFVDNLPDVIRGQIGKNITAIKKASK